MAVTQGLGEAKENALLYKYKWLAIPNGNNGNPIGAESTGVPYDQSVFADKSVQITGTFGAAGSIQLEGSNDQGTTWAILNDAFGNTLVFTSAGLKQITECVEQVRPRVTAGDGTTSLNCYLFMRKVVT